MVRQEIWALLLTHYGIRVIRRHVTAQADFSP
jgi:hypothetical protein